MEELHVMVIGPQGLLESKDYNEAQGNDIFNFYITLTEKMFPISTVIAYYIKGDGAVIYDGYTMDFGSTIEQSVKIIKFFYLNFRIFCKNKYLIVIFIHFLSFISTQQGQQSRTKMLKLK
jgi:hypothetical protein